MVFSNGVLHHTPDIEKSFSEVHRVLKPGGDFWVIVYHRNSIFYWMSLWFVEHLLKLGFLKRSFKERLSMIEFSTSHELPIVNVYSRATLRNMLEQAGFSVSALWVRKLLREDLPAIPLLNMFYNFIPQEVLDKAGKYFGWYLIALAHKT